MNGVDTYEVELFRELASKDPTAAEREPTVVAHWLGGDAIRAECGDASTHIGAEGELNAMQTLLASLAACDAGVVAMHAALIGLELEELSVEASGHFNVRAYLGVDGAEPPGYDRIAYRVRLRAPGATPEQLDHLRRCCERSSPVGSSLARAVPMTFELEAA